MGTETRGLGRGLDALLGGSARETKLNPAEVKNISISSILPNKYQPRIDFSQSALEDLAASIKAQGVLQPILLRPLENNQYELIAGERRLRASKLAGLHKIPALIREMSDEQSLALALIENLQREDLNPIEEAQGYRRLISEFSLNQELLAQQVGKSRSSVANALRLLKLPQAVQKEIAAGTLSAGHGRALMTVKDAQGFRLLLERVRDLKPSVRQVEAEATYYNQHGEFPQIEKKQAKSSTKQGITKKSIAIDEKLLHFMEVLKKVYTSDIVVSGTRSQGKVVFRFANNTELQALAKQLGVQCELGE